MIIAVLGHDLNAYTPFLQALRAHGMNHTDYGVVVVVDRLDETSLPWLRAGSVDHAVYDLFEKTIVVGFST